MTKNNRTILGWCFYDFANQPFTTIVVTFIYSAYFVGGISSETGLAGGIVGSSAMGQVYWGNITAICAVIIALLSPIMGAAADEGGYRKSFLLFWTWICIIFSILLFFPTYGDIYTALILFAIANIAFEMGGVFCNAYVSDISQSNNMGKISGYGYAFGYLGGLLALIFCLFTIYIPEKPMFGISKGNDGVIWESCVSNSEWEEGYGDGKWNHTEPFMDNNSNGFRDPDEIFLDSHILKEKKKGEGIIYHNGNHKIFEIVKDYDKEELNDDVSCLNYPIKVFQETINKSFVEYLVNFDYFIRVMENFGFVPVPDDEVDELKLPSPIGHFGSLHNYLVKEVELKTINKSSIGQSLTMSYYEKKISFLNKYFVFKKVRNVDSESVVLENKMYIEELDKTSENTEIVKIKRKIKLKKQDINK